MRLSGRLPGKAYLTDSCNIARAHFSDVVCDAGGRDLWVRKKRGLIRALRLSFGPDGSLALCSVAALTCLNS